MSGLYIHVPICISKCRYCDFYSVTAKERDEVESFVQCLELELNRLPESFAPETVFVGGGTPTALEPLQLGRLLESIFRSVDFSKVVEFTVEVNPGTLTPQKISILKGGGVNRASIGVQSFNGKALRLLGRVHNPDDALAGYSMLRDAGFDNLNIDLIQSIPGMKPEDVLDDVRRAIALSPEHISCYNLIYEPGTPMTLDRDAGRIVLPGEDEEADNYFAVKALLEKSGYMHYEISNFCKTGRECRHNLLYWQGGDYFGTGPSAHSHWNGARFGNVPDLQAYCDRLRRNEKPFDELECLAAKDKARETLVMWLRLISGVDTESFRKLTGFDIDQLCGEAVAELTRSGLLQHEGKRLQLTRDALFICNTVFADLV